MSCCHHHPPACCREIRRSVRSCRLFVFPSSVQKIDNLKAELTQTSIGFCRVGLDTYDAINRFLVRIRRDGMDSLSRKEVRFTCIASAHDVVFADAGPDLALSVNWLLSLCADPALVRVPF